MYLSDLQELLEFLIYLKQTFGYVGGQGGQLTHNEKNYLSKVAIELLNKKIQYLQTVIENTEEF